MRMLRRVPLLFNLIWMAPAFAVTPVDSGSQMIISVKDQKLMLVQPGGKVSTYPVSTSMFGLGDAYGHMTTPLGYLEVEKKIGDNAPVGAVFHNRRWTGEVLQPNAPGRDPVTTRIIWLRGLEPQNAHAFQRCIYIHGTPEEKKIGRPASYGCIRMKATDVAALYDRIPLGTLVQITPDRLPKAGKIKVPRSETSNGIVAVTAPAAPVETKPETPDRLPKETESPRVESTHSVVAATALAGPPEHLLPDPPQPTRHHSHKHSAGSGSPSVEEMRMAGGLAAQKQKAKLALGKRL